MWTTISGFESRRATYMSDKIAYLECPECGDDGVPSSGVGTEGQFEGEPTWCEDDEADCLGCGVHLVVQVDEYAYLSVSEDHPSTIQAYHRMDTEYLKQKEQPTC